MEKIEEFIKQLKKQKVIFGNPLSNSFGKSFEQHFGETADTFIIETIANGFITD